MKKRFFLLILISALITSFFVFADSCGKTYDNDEIIENAKKLINESYEINEIFFGKGLPVEKTEEMEDQDFYLISEDSKYKTEKEIKDAALSVYSKGYCEYLFTKAFVGFVTDLDDSSDISVVKSISARFADYSGAFVQIELDEDDIMTLNRTYDVDNIELISVFNDQATISVPSFVDGKQSNNVKLKLVFEENGWRLDSPTY